MSFDTFFSDILATIVGGIALTVLFFLLKEKIFGFPELTGKWFFQTEVSDTAYIPYEGMILKYIAILWREGDRVSGTIEKIHEKSSAGEREYIGDKRTRGNVEGYIDKKYFSEDKVYLHIVEQGEKRESTSFYDLLFNKDGNMKGTFTSTVANQSGKTTWQRKHF